MLYDYQLSCLGSSVRRVFGAYRGFESHLGQLFFFLSEEEGGHSLQAVFSGFSRKKPDFQYFS